jgi:hypothetical protein
MVVSSSIDISRKESHQISQLYIDNTHRMEQLGRDSQILPQPVKRAKNRYRYRFDAKKKNSRTGPVFEDAYKVSQY